MRSFFTVEVRCELPYLLLWEKYHMVFYLQGHLIDRLTGIVVGRFRSYLSLSLSLTITCFMALTTSIFCLFVCVFVPATANFFLQSLCISFHQQTETAFYSCVRAFCDLFLSLFTAAASPCPQRYLFSYMSLVIVSQDKSINVEKFSCN